jgi:hypothetical protein
LGLEHTILLCDVLSRVVLSRVITCQYLRKPSSYFKNKAFLFQVYLEVTFNWQISMRCVYRALGQKKLFFTCKRSLCILVYFLIFSLQFSYIIHPWRYTGLAAPCICAGIPAAELDKSCLFPTPGFPVLVQGWGAGQDSNPAGLSTIARRTNNLATPHQ